MRILPLVYWSARENYGDYLSPFIVHNLSGLPIRPIDVNYLQKSWKTLFRDLIMHGNWHMRLWHRFYPSEKNYVCIGSIIGQGNKNSHYWGTGCLRGINGHLKGYFYAVRGNLSKNEILRCKFDRNLRIMGDISVGDPALLLPMLIPAKVKKQHKVGIIPHYVDYSFFKLHYGDRYFIIDIASPDVEKITKQIISCECILSTSLHGIIVAHAYNIPALWIERIELQPGSNGFKFRDYFSSVGLDYDPIRNIEETLQNQSNIEKLFLDNKNNSLPNVDLNSIRINLLKSAPFPIKKQFLDNSVLF